MMELALQFTHASFLFLALFEKNFHLKEYCTLSSFLLILICVVIEYVFKIIEITQNFVKLIESCREKDKEKKFKVSQQKQKIADVNSGSSHNLEVRNPTHQNNHREKKPKLRLRRNNFVNPHEMKNESMGKN